MQKKTMNVLHISNDFPNSNLYKHLVNHIDQLGIGQTVYSAVRTQEESQFDLPKWNSINIKNILKPYDRAFYRFKIRKIYKDLVSQVDLKKIDIVHAHTLYSDGGVAFKLKKNKNIPYIVAVRSTDMFSFQKYRPDLRSRRNNILRNASKIIFISPTHRDYYLSLLHDSLNKEIAEKVATIPNGLDPVFLEQSPRLEEKKDSKLKILFVGTFKKRKNALNLIKSVKKLSNKHPVLLTLVGSGGSQEDTIKAEKHPSINYVGQISDRIKLREIYRENDIFVMVSKSETFGLVYTEALSQGLPIIHRKDDSVDGYFKEGTVAETVKDMDNADEIAQKIISLSQRLNLDLRKECVKQAQRFSWSKIVKTYEEIYKSML